MQDQGQNYLLWNGNVFGGEIQVSSGVCNCSITLDVVGIYFLQIRKFLTHDYCPFKSSA